MDPKSPLISVLIVNYNGLKHLPECLDSLHGQTFRDFEIVLVDNASRDGSVEWIRANHPRVKLVISDRNRGFAGGNNFGLPHCRGEFVYFLNNDTAAEAEALEALVRARQSHPHVRIFASFLINYRDRSKVDSAGDTVYTCGKSTSFSGYPIELFRAPRFITSACAGAALYARAILDSLSGFDEDFFLNFEDIDLSFRAQHAGEKILFVPDSKVYHKGSASLGGKKSALSLYYFERNYGLFVAKNFPGPELLRFLPSILFVKVWGLFAALWFRVPGAYLRGNLSFLMQLGGIPAKRRKVLSGSRLSRAEFRALLRPHWLKEKIAFLKGRYDGVP